MPEPTLNQVFGANAVQDASMLTISKADLASVGLTPSANNTAESLFVALILKAATYLTPTNQGDDPLFQVTVEDSGFPLLTTRGGNTYRQTTFNVNMQKPDNGSAIDPDDY